MRNMYGTSVNSINSIIASDFYDLPRNGLNIGVIFYPISLLMLGEGSSNPPLLKDLVVLKVPPTKWYQLGLQLNLDERKLDMIKTNNQANVEACIMEMFKEWLKNTADASYAELESALNRMGEHSVAASVLPSSSCKVENVMSMQGALWQF